MTQILHKNPVNGDAKAPYNFVPSPERLLLSEAFTEFETLVDGRYHGHLELLITSETRIYTRCAYPIEAEGGDAKQSPELRHFYHWGEPAVPILPGSSLRGCIRSLVEILSYSRLSRKNRPRVSDSRLMYRAVASPGTSVGKTYQEKFLQTTQQGPRKVTDFPGPRLRAGYLESRPGGWAIRPAREFEGESFIRIKMNDTGYVPPNTTHPIWVQPAPRQRRSKGSFDLNYALTQRFSKRAEPGLKPGTLVASGEMATKHMHTVVYEKNPEADALEIPAPLWDLYKVDREIQRGIPNRKLTKEGEVVFYLVDANGRLEFFGPNLFFRLPYDLTPADLLDDETDPDRLDFAESLFGTVVPKPVRGRVTFSDAEPIAGQSDLVATDVVYPEVLSSPKPNSYQNYLVQTGHNSTQLKSYTEEDRKKTGLRGFKRYWHRRHEQSLKELPQEGVDQYTAIRPVRDQAQFQSTVHFENLSPEELGGLLTALELPTSCRHQFGMGKPRGFGSIKIEVRAIRLFNPKERYRSFNPDGAYSDGQKIGAQAKADFGKRVLEHTGHKGPTVWDIPRLRELLCLLQWDKRPEESEVLYLKPTTQPGKSILKNREVLPCPSQVLPSPLLGAPVGSNNSSDARTLVDRDRLEGVVVKTRGQDWLLEVEGIVVSLAQKGLKKLAIHDGSKLAVRVGQEKHGDYHRAEFIELL